MKKFLKRILIVVLVLGCVGVGASVLATKSNLLDELNISLPFLRKDKIEEISDNAELKTSLNITEGNYTYDRQTFSIDYTGTNSIQNYTKEYDYISKGINQNTVDADLIIVNLSDYYNSTGNDFKNSLLYTNLIAVPGNASYIELDGYLYVKALVGTSLDAAGEINLPNVSDINETQAIAIEKCIEFYKLYENNTDENVINYEGKNEITFSTYTVTE